MTQDKLKKFDREFLYENVVFLAQDENSCFSADILVNILRLYRLHFSVRIYRGIID